MTHDLDCRGLACPAPVLQLRDLLDAAPPPARVSVLVDNEAAWQNVCKLFDYHHYQTNTERAGDEFKVTGTRTAGSAAPTRSAAPSPSPRQRQEGKKILVVVGSNRMGHGDDTLGEKLMINFLKTVTEMGPELWRLVFINSGVTLTTEGSEAVPVLQQLEREGVPIFACGACLTHFGLLSKKQVGETTNMLDIVTAMQLADSVITL